mmetsp:Transcript_19002/g.49007  ORF Transcript_19002/g.49007 Transcript_19002/m.49007 type:complete len:135 (+) Transcript_19002:82-486(+)
MADTLTVKVPKGQHGGDVMQINHNNQLFNVTIPAGLAPGDDFVIHVPQAAAQPAVPTVQAQVVGTPMAPPPYAQGAAADYPSAQVVYGQPAPTSSAAVCRGCGRQFTRRPDAKPQTAQWFRCEECQGVSFCTIM